MRNVIVIVAALLSGGCVHNINTVGPSDLSGIRPVVGSTLAVVQRKADTGQGRGSATPPHAALQQAFASSGVFSKVVLADQVPLAGYAIEARSVAVSNKMYPDKLGPVGALFQIPLMAFVPWQTTFHYTENYDVYHQSRLLATYTFNFNSKGMISWNPMFMLFGKPGAWRGAADDAFLASRHAGWVLARLQQDGHLGGAKP